MSFNGFAEAGAGRYLWEGVFAKLKYHYIMKECIMSFFHAPISNKVPAGVCNVAGLHTYITTDKRLEELTLQVRADDGKLLRKRKQTLLPYVTPAGVFSYCKEQCIVVPSGLFVIDIDHLDSTGEAVRWRDRLFDDEVLRPDLAFISPGAKGVKLFVPYRTDLTCCLEQAFDNALHAAWEYLEWRHGLKPDTANADLSRACFLSHDGEARARL